MCQDITSILRYISSDKESVSTVEEELEHCSLYLNCMKMRFKDKFTYEFDIGDDLLDLKIPKLCIQLLIENSVKFVSKTAPPWHCLLYTSYSKEAADIKGPVGHTAHAHIQPLMDLFFHGIPGGKNIS